MDLPEDMWNIIIGDNIKPHGGCILVNKHLNKIMQKKSVNIPGEAVIDIFYIGKINFPINSEWTDMRFPTYGKIRLFDDEDTAILSRQDVIASKGIPCGYVKDNIKEIIRIPLDYGRIFKILKEGQINGTIEYGYNPNNGKFMMRYLK